MDSQASDTTPGAVHVFVGRAREVAELRAGLDEVCSGRGRLFLLCGEAGIGKTRLSEEVAGSAAAGAVRVAWGRCWEGGGAPPFWPWVQIIRALLADLSPRQREEALGDSSVYLAQLVPEIRTGSAPPPPLAPTANDTAQFAMLDALASFLCRIAAERPLALFLDDLHAADEPTLLALDFVARQISAVRLFIVGTYREAEARRSPERATLLNRIARHGKHLPLGGLSEPDVAAFVQEGFRTSATADVVAALHHTTHGNPFFLDEVVRLLIANPSYAQLDHIPASGLPIPAAVRDAVRDRLYPLSPLCRHILQVAAVVGRDFDLATLTAVCDAPPQAILDALQEASVAVLVTPPAPGTASYCFEHALIRDTLYDDLPAGERARLHERIGETLLTRYADAGDAHIARVAHHFLQCVGPAAAARASELAMRAACKAESIFAFEEAATWYTHALRTSEFDAVQPIQRAELLLALGRCQSKAWNTGPAEDTFRRASELARAQRSYDPLAAGRLLARASLGFGGTGIGMPRGVANAELVALLEEAAQLLGEADAALKARVQSRLAIELYFADAAERRRALVGEAVDLAEHSGDRAALAYVLNVRLIALWDIPNPHDRLAMADAALRAAQDVGDGDLELRARLFRIIDLVDLGAFREWMHETERYAQSAARLREPIHQSGLTMLRIMNALWMGQFGEAESLCADAMASAEQLEDQNAGLSTRLQLFALRRAQGRLAELEPLIRFAATTPSASPALRCMLVVVDADLGNLAQARTGFEQLGAQDFTDLARGNHLASLLAWLVELACQFGSPRHLSSLHDHVSAAAPGYLSFPARLCFGPSAYYLALLEAALGQTAQATDHFEIAIEECKKHAVRPALAAAQHAYAEMLATSTSPDFAKVTVLRREARQAASDLGMRGLLAKIDATTNPTEDVQQPERQRDVRQASGGSISASRVLPFPSKPTTSKSEPRRRAPLTLASRAEAEDSHDSAFRFERGLWTITHQGTVLRLKNSKGLRYLAELLREPEREIHVSELTALDRLPVAPTHLTDDDLQKTGMRVATADSGEALVDRRARSEYKRRLSDLDEQLREARSFNDRGRVAVVEAEIEAISEALANAVGLGGRNRMSASQVERERLNVTRAIQTAIKRIREAHPELGRHLANAVRTGTFCRYAPDPRQTIAWRF